jgi:hypothetical protein
MHLQLLRVLIIMFHYIKGAKAVFLNGDILPLAEMASFTIDEMGRSGAYSLNVLLKELM